MFHSQILGPRTFGERSPSCFMSPGSIAAEEDEAMFTAVVGHSEDLETSDADADGLVQCRERLKGTAPTAGLLFAAIDFDHQVMIDRINREFPGIQLIGCSTDGEISSELGFREDSVTLILFASDTVDITAGLGRG